MTDTDDQPDHVTEQTATADEIREWNETHDEPHPVFEVQHRPERDHLEHDGRVATHIVPVETADEQTVFPITGRKTPTGPVIHIHPHVDDDTDDDLSDAVDRLEYLTDHLLGLRTVRHATDGWDEMFHIAYGQAMAVLNDDDGDGDGDELWINATERGALAMLVATLVGLENPEQRHRLHLYRATEDGYEELPIAPHPKRPTMADAVLDHLADSNPYSISQLAREMNDGEVDSSERSRVQYNVSQLAERGYVRLDHDSHAAKPTLTPMGELLARGERTGENS